MDTFVTETLTAWQLEHLIDTFKDQEVDEESFRLLDATAIASLIPKIGHRVKFQKHHKELTAIASNTPSSAEGSPSSADTSVAPVEESTSGNLLTVTLNLQPSFAIRPILQGTSLGKKILQSLEEKRSITSKQRKELVRLLVSHLLETNGETPSNDTKKALAMALVHEFPCLNLDGPTVGSGYAAWYTPGRGKKPASGFLEERLRNTRKRMRRLKRPHHQEPEEQTVPSTPESDVPPEKLLEMVEWMKVNRYPVSQVEDYMNQTALHRGKWIRSNGTKSVPEILAEFPRLVDNPGMISQDFKLLHPDAVGKLFQNWATLSDRILTYAQREGKLPAVFDDMTPDRALKVLPILLPPPVFKMGGKVYRPTIEESCKFFINIQPVGTNMVQYLQTIERTQPFPHILCLGDDMTTSQVFTIVSDSAIEMDTLLGAVDLCFKAFFVFDLGYTKQCLPTWEFIQHAVYEIDGGHESSNVKFLRTSIAA